MRWMAQQWRPIPPIPTQVTTTTTTWSVNVGTHNTQECRVYSKYCNQLGVLVTPHATGAQNGHSHGPRPMVALHESGGGAVNSQRLDWYRYSRSLRQGLTVMIMLMAVMKKIKQGHGDSSTSYRDTRRLFLFLAEGFHVLPYNTWPGFKRPWQCRAGYSK